METEKEREGEGEKERERTSDKKTDITTKNSSSAYVSLKPR